MTELDRHIVRETFAALKPRADVLAKRFFERLLAEHPQLKRLFERVDLRELHQKLIQSCVLIVGRLESPDQLARYLHELGRRHLAYGVRPQDFQPFIATFLQSLEDVAGPAWTAQSESAWRAVMRSVTDTMQEAVPAKDSAARGPAGQAAGDQTAFGQAPGELYRSIEEATKTVSDAFSQVEAAEATLNAFGKSSVHISPLGEQLRSMAEQANVLSLNAKLESLRAGERQENIALLADNVTQLSRQMAEAANEIGTTINGLEASHCSAAAAVGSISGLLTRLDQIVADLGRIVPPTKGPSQARPAPKADGLRESYAWRSRALPLSPKASAGGGCSG